MSSDNNHKIMIVPKSGIKRYTNKHRPTIIKKAMYHLSSVSNCLLRISRADKNITNPNLKNSEG